MNAGLSSFLEAKLSRLSENGNRRSLRPVSNLIDFYSNDYLGLARSSELHQWNLQRFATLNSPFNGATGSRLLSGNSREAEELEQFLATVFQCEAALIFNSGYAANLAVISSLPQKGDRIIYDEFSHACIKDGARLSLADHFNFRHNDLNDLEKKIAKAKGRKWIVAESLYSMDGDICPLADLVELAERYEAFIILDEAHSTGNLGVNGAGMAVSKNLQNKVAVRIHTFGKAMGTHGACVAGSKLLIDYLINFARPFIYSTAPSPIEIISIGNAFRFLQKNIQLQDQLIENIDFFTRALGESDHFGSPVFSRIIGGNEGTRKAAAQLQAEHLDVRPILSPTVKAGTERLRICLHTYNTQNELRKLADQLKAL